MKIVVRVELTTDWGEVTQVEIEKLARPARQLQSDTVGLCLQDGKRVLERLQQAVVQLQAYEYCQLHRVCTRCHRWNPIKDYRQRKLDTIFGSVRVDSPRIISCPCEPPYFLETAFSPLSGILPERATPELQLLHAKLCANMSYRQAAGIVREFLPVSKKFNHVTLRNRTLRIGERIDKVPPTAAFASQAKRRAEWTLAIDGGFVRGIGKGELRNFGLLTGRLATPGEKPYVFAWVGSEEKTVTQRVTTLARGRTGCEQPNLTVITDGANNTQSIPHALPFPTKTILDWFHISMRVRHLEQIVSGLWPKTETERATKKVLAQEVGKLRWCFWHANRDKAQKKLQGILLLCRIVVAETPKYEDSLHNLDYRVRELFAYLRSNEGTLTQYGKRYRAGKLISTALAESAVNQILNARMCKRQQMRWTPRGAHLLAQVPCAVINGDLAQRLQAYDAANAEDMSPETSQFLDLLQRAAA